MMPSQVSFGYPWWITYGHLVIVAVALALWFIGRSRKWSKVPMLLVGAIFIWSIAAFLVARFAINVNGRLSLPSQAFLATGVGRVLDMGAGTGRSTLMVLESRPQAKVVALDLFTESYEEHFGSAGNGKERLASNLRVAGVDDRASIQAGDMRRLPFDPGWFDGVVSTYAIDHLNREGIALSVREASRVLKPGGQFLMMVVSKDSWLNFAFGPLLFHSGTRSQEWWTSRLQEAGFQMIEQGTRPATLYFLAQKQ